jgi:acyl carrier protein
MQRTMSREEADTTVRESLWGFAAESDLAALDADEPLREALELDSIDFLTFVERLSAAYGGRIEELDYPRLESIHSCVDFLTRASA